MNEAEIIFSWRKRLKSNMNIVSLPYEPTNTWEKAATWLRAAIENKKVLVLQAFLVYKHCIILHSLRENKKHYEHNVRGIIFF